MVKSTFQTHSFVSLCVFKHVVDCGVRSAGMLCPAMSEDLFGQCSNSRPTALCISDNSDLRAVLNMVDDNLLAYCGKQLIQLRYAVYSSHKSLQRLRKNDRLAMTFLSATFPIILRSSSPSTTCTTQYYSTEIVNCQSTAFQSRSSSSSVSLPSPAWTLNSQSLTTTACSGS